MDQPWVVKQQDPATSREHRGWRPGLAHQAVVALKKVMLLKRRACGYRSALVQSAGSGDTGTSRGPGGWLSSVANFTVRVYIDHGFTTRWWRSPWERALSRCGLNRTQDIRPSGIIRLWEP